MEQAGQEVNTGSSANGKAVATAARCLPISDAGITTSQQLAAFMSAMMGDLIAGRVKAQVASAAINAGGKLLKIVELQQKYGSNGENGGQKVLRLVE